MLEEDRLHPLISTLPYFEVIRGIQIQERKGLDWGMAVKHASMDGLLQSGFRLVRSKGIKFDAVAAKIGVRRNY